MNQEKSNCKSCGKPIEDSKENIDMFEGMHWLCFHYAFEHQGDPDEPCRSRHCPTWHLEILKKYVSNQGSNPTEIINTEIENIWNEEK